MSSNTSFQASAVGERAESSTVEQAATPTFDLEFWSSVECAGFVRSLQDELGHAGHRVDHVFSIAQADYWSARGRLARLGIRLRAYAGYPLRVAARFTAARRPVVGVVTSNTFYAPWLAARLGRRSRVRLVHWVFDLFPDVLVANGSLRDGSVACRVLRGVVRSAFARASVNVFLGERLLAFAETKFGPIPRAVVIPIGADDAAARDDEPAPRANEPVRMLYCGNLGRMHDIDTVAGVLRTGWPEGLQVEFRGNGSGFGALATEFSGSPFGHVSFGGNLPADQWRAAMHRADLALVTLRRGAEGLVFPSKFFSALAAGQAVVAVAPRASDLADAVVAHDLGWVVEPGDAQGLRSVLNEIVSSPAEVLRRRRNAWKASRTVYAMTNIAKQWEKMVRAETSRQNTRD